jgi:hypothetical protein
MAMWPEQLYHLPMAAECVASIDLQFRLGSIEVVQFGMKRANPLHGSGGQRDQYLHQVRTTDGPA